jgi:hypothetical protein
MYYGAGAGQGSTASAILSDVMLLAAADDNETLRRLNPLRVPAGVRDLAGPGSRHEGHFLRINHVRPDKVHESLPWPVVGSGHGWITFDVPPLEGSEREEMLGRLEPLGVVKGDLFEMRHAVLG